MKTVEHTYPVRILAPFGAYEAGKVYFLAAGDAGFLTRIGVGERTSLDELAGAFVSEIRSCECGRQLGTFRTSAAASALTDLEPVKDHLRGRLRDQAPAAVIIDADEQAQCPCGRPLAREA